MTGTSENKNGKAKFVAPKLQVYGRARDITQGTGNTGNKDNPSFNPKTRP
jgi:hypothetical protein